MCVRIFFKILVFNELNKKTCFFWVNQLHRIRFYEKKIEKNTILSCLGGLKWNTLEQNGIFLKFIFRQTKNLLFLNFVQRMQNF